MSLPKVMDEIGLQLDLSAKDPDLTRKAREFLRMPIPDVPMPLKNDLREICEELHIATGWPETMQAGSPAVSTVGCPSRYSVAAAGAAA
jgi:hypothetical protein